MTDETGGRIPGQPLVLVADAAADVRKEMRDYLHWCSYTVVEAENGPDAFACARDMEPDIIIADVHLPELSGVELLESLREKVRFTPFILTSASSKMEDVLSGLRAGAWDYLHKPIHPLDLLRDSLDRVGERSKWLQDLRHRQDLEELVQRRTMDLLTQNRNYEKEITTRQRMEEQARQAEAEWRRTVDALPEMVAIIDRSRNIVRVNRSFLGFLGKTEEEVLGTSCLMCSGEHSCLHEATLQDGKGRTAEIVLDDRETVLEMKIVPYSSSDGGWLGSVHVFRDITETKREEREKQIRQSKALHSQKLESVGQLASGIAHEINTPTQFVSSNLAFLEEAFGDIGKMIAGIEEAAAGGELSAERIRTQLDEADWEYLEEEIPSALQQSHEGVDRVSTIVRAMREFSRPGNRETREVDINNLIDVTVTVARNEWKYVAEMELDLDSGIPPVRCLSDEMGQVILNLLVNAAQAIEEKLGKVCEGEKGTIRIETRKNEKWVEIAISDTGNGIPLSLTGRIFDPFFTTKPVGKGTGQGLAIAYDVVVNKHRGNIRVESEPREETTFIIQLPLES